MPSKPLPSGWTEMTFGEMASQISERVDDPQKAGVDIYVGLEHLDPGDLRIRRRGTPGDVEATKLRVRPGQIIFGKRRAYQRKVAVADFDGIVSAHAMILQEKPSLVPGFLPFFMQSDVFMDRAVTISEGGLSPTIKWKTLAAEKFLLPPPQQQRELVELMQGFEVAVEAASQSVLGMRSLRGRLLHELLHPTEAYSVMPLRKIAKVEIGRQRSPAHTQGKRPMKYVRAANIKDGKLDLSQLNEMDFTEKEQLVYQLKRNDILIVEGGATVGHYAIFTDYSESLCMQKTVIRVRADMASQVSPGFLFHLVAANHESGRLEAAAQGSGIKHLGIEGVANLVVNLPDDNGTRSRAAHKLDELGKSLQNAEQHLINLRTLHFSILNTGLTPSATAEEPALAEVLA